MIHIIKHVKYKRYIVRLFLLYSFVVLTSCSKYLDAKPDKTLAVPTTLQDLQLMLDNYVLLNNFYPVTSEILADNYYITTPIWQSLQLDLNRNLYVWKEDNQTGQVWQQAYAQILTFNVVLDNVDKIEIETDGQYSKNNIKGSALFFRAHYYHGLAQLFAPPYKNGDNNLAPGLVLRLTSDFSAKSVRSTVNESYQQIIADLKASIPLLPDKSEIKSRPSKPAAYGALARTYLAMQDYVNARYYANECLKMYNSLMDFNDLNKNAAAPIPRFNPEVIFQMRSGQNAALVPGRAIVDSTLYRTYLNGDLRKSIYYTPYANGVTYRFKGDYDGTGTSSGYVFSGIVTDEMYLIRAEGNAREGKLTEAMSDLNYLLKTRWDRAMPFTEFTATNRNEAIKIILQERRKELFFRGTRWTDLRRLQFEPDFAVIPKRVINNQEYILDVNSPRYTIKLPLEVINITGIAQNP